jgi:hypothetical protein
MEPLRTSAAPTDGFGYLLVHFVEDPVGHGETIWFSLSVGDDPLHWRRLGDGPVLESTAGTTGLRDPHLVRGPDGYHLMATDLRVWRPEGADWTAFRHHGSRDLVIWDSPDLIRWSGPRYVTVVPPEAGMAWAPEAVYDPISGDFLVHWSSGLTVDAPDSVRTGPSRILMARTRDFVSFTQPETYLQLPDGVIDMTLHVTQTGVHRFAKHDDRAEDSLHVFHQVGSSLFADDFVTVARDIGQELSDLVEAPLVFKSHHEDRWYLWVDQYGQTTQGYQHAYTTTDLASGRWELLSLHLPANTKHGVVLPLTRREYDAVSARYLGPGT